MSEPLIRRATPADAEVLAAVGAETFCETFSHLYSAGDLARFLAETHGPDRTRAALSDPGSASWLAEAGGQVIGYATVGPCGLPHPEVTPDCGELKRLYLRRAWQNGGLGRRLFEASLAWLQSAGPRAVWVGVWSQNHGAQRFYGRQGFAKVGEYGFRVGQTIDHEYILRRRAESFSGANPRTFVNRDNPP